MKKELVKEFQRKISQATRSELVIIHYDMLLAQLAEVKEGLETENDFLFEKAMTGAYKMLRELSGNLDFAYDISKELMSIYIYINKKLIDISLHLKVADVEETQKILGILREGWRLAEFDDEDQVVSNSQKVYAGLTYHHGQLTELVDNGRRGVKA